jgi:predicted transport protein
MSDIKLFQKNGSSLSEITSSSAPLERSLQTTFENNLEALLGVRFLASEYATTNGGRMDTLGIDENGYPVIIEYKRDRSENVINQGLFYLDWLMDHRGDFELLVRDTFDKATADAVEWSAPRLICIAADFSKFDAHAIKQMSRNIELIRYRQFGEDLLMLDLLTTVSTKPMRIADPVKGKAQRYKTNAQSLADANASLSDLYSDIETYMMGLGDDVVRKELQNYFAFKRIKNFACIEVKPQINVIRLYLKVDPSTVELEEGVTRDVSSVGHFGTGDLEVTVSTHEGFESAKDLIVRSYDAS